MWGRGPLVTAVLASLLQPQLPFFQFRTLDMQISRHFIKRQRLSYTTLELSFLDSTACSCPFFFNVFSHTFRQTMPEAGARSKRSSSNQEERSSRKRPNIENAASFPRAEEAITEEEIQEAERFQDVPSEAPQARNACKRTLRHFQISVEECPAADRSRSHSPHGTQAQAASQSKHSGEGLGQLCRPQWTGPLPRQPVQH